MFLASSNASKRCRRNDKQYRPWLDCSCSLIGAVHLGLHHLLMPICPTLLILKSLTVLSAFSKSLHFTSTTKCKVKGYCVSEESAFMKIWLDAKLKAAWSYFENILNQRTIGPVSLTWVLRICWNQWLLRKGSLNIVPGTMFKLPFLNNCLGRGRQPIRAKILMSTGRPPHYGHLLQVWKESLQPLTLYTSFHNLITTGQGQTTPGDKIFISTETSCHFGHLLQVSKKSLWSLILYIFFFMILYMYTAPGQGLTRPWGQIFYVNRNILSLWSFVAR